MNTSTSRNVGIKIFFSRNKRLSVWEPQAVFDFLIYGGTLHLKFVIWRHLPVGNGPAWGYPGTSGQGQVQGPGWGLGGEQMSWLDSAVKSWCLWACPFNLWYIYEAQRRRTVIQSDKRCKWQRCLGHVFDVGGWELEGHLMWGKDRARLHSILASYPMVHGVLLVTPHI